jgi:predicted permease
MDIFLITLESIFTLLGIGIIGFWIIAKKIIPAGVMGVLSPLAIDIALPCLIFSNIVMKFNTGTLPQWWQLPLWWAAMTALFFLMTLVASVISHRKVRTEFRISLFYQNGLFLPLALLVGIPGTGADVLVALFIFMLFYPAFFFNTYTFFFKTGRGRPSGFERAKRIANPVLIATTIALILVLSGLQHRVPGFITQITVIMGNMAVPLIILIIGGAVFINYQKKEGFPLAEIIKFVIIKMCLPSVVLGFIYCFRPD